MFCMPDAICLRFGEYTIYDLQSANCRHMAKYLANHPRLLTFLLVKHNNIYIFICISFPNLISGLEQPMALVNFPTCNVYNFI